MDISVMIERDKFNFRVAAIMLHENKILVMNDERGSYDYLPGGRVQINEPVQEALLRELSEELGIFPKIVRPLWFNECFFTEQMSGVDYHELCIYFLVDISNTDLLEKGESFTIIDEPHTFNYRWVNIEDLKDMAFFPLFLKEEIFNLPESFTILTEYQ